MGYLIAALVASLIAFVLMLLPHVARAQADAPHPGEAVFISEYATQTWVGITEAAE